MKFKLKSILKDKNVLYIVFFLALVNLFGYLMAGNLDAVIFFLILGYLTSYFSKNMIVVMLAAIILTNLFVSSRYLGQKPLLEGMESKENASPKPVDEAEEQAEATGKPKVDYSATLEAAYDNIDKLLSSDALSNMSNETQRLAEKQQKLMGNIAKLEPMMQKAGSLLEGLDMGKMSGLMTNLDKKLKKMNVGKK
tara:strand:+ start:174 stop:758 length:585 start_codon:yes stop_codon:yes gene_type:complete